ncbi:hypothetical protein ACGF07_11700 [Kitasatospora sp. NPDC048194]|uniref:hypothetical protein n=1 Tax=Kitasatospora sp. NPDC048194 TaxID=3364045 RepID=UPI003722B137
MALPPKGLIPRTWFGFHAVTSETTAPLIGQRVSEHLGGFLLVKCFFFLALMRPTDPTRHDKHIKWQYRRTLFRMGLDQYESSCTIDTGTFPTLERFIDEHRQAGSIRKPAETDHPSGELS